MHDVAHLAVLVPHAGLQAGADVGVGPHVHGLLLAPHELSIGVAPQLPLDQVEGEGHQLQTHTPLFRWWMLCMVWQAQRKLCMPANGM